VKFVFTNVSIRKICKMGCVIYFMSLGFFFFFFFCHTILRHANTWYTYCSHMHAEWLVNGRGCLEGVECFFGCRPGLFDPRGLTFCTEACLRALNKNLEKESFSTLLSTIYSGLFWQTFLYDKVAQNSLSHSINLKSYSRAQSLKQKNPLSYQVLRVGVGWLHLGTH